MITMPRKTLISLYLIILGLLITVVCDIFNLGAWNFIGTLFSLIGLVYASLGVRDAKRLRG